MADDKMTILLNSGRCTCNYRAEFDGCTEWSCLYHGKVNEANSLYIRDHCPQHGKKES